jgi:hypothetical protein
MLKFSDIFKRKKLVTEIQDKSYNTIARTQAIGGYAASARLEDIYKGTDHNYDLAVGSYNKQLLAVARLVGVPVLKEGEYPRIQSLLLDEGYIITLRALISGTHWILPRFQKNGGLGIEHIKDSDIGSGGLRFDPVTGALEAIVIEEQVNWLEGQWLNWLAYANRKRRYTEDEIYEVWTGARNENLTRKNTLGIMPTPFAFNSLGEIRGISAYAGVLRLLRDIHEMRRNRDEILAQAKPKAVITSNDWNEWTNRNMKANGQGAMYDPFEAAVATCTPEEKFEFLTLPSGVIADYTAAIQDNSLEQLISSPLPEIFNGKAMQGNYASVDSQVTIAENFIRTVQREMFKAWKKLVSDMAKLENYMNFSLGAPPPKISFDNLELASPLTRSQILQNIISTTSTMISGGVPVEIGFELIKRLHPSLPYEKPGEMADAIRSAKADMPAESEIGAWGL